MIQEFKILRYVMQPEIRLTGLSLCGGSQQGGGVQGRVQIIVGAF